MKVQHHINSSKLTDGLYPNVNGWYQCKTVMFEGETATWELSRTGHYDFMDAYKMNPHRQLVQATNDNLLRAFIRAWGPLRMVLGVWSGSDAIDDYRKARDRITVATRVLASVEEPDLQRFALRGFVDMLSAWDMFPPLFEGLRRRYTAGSDVGRGENEDRQKWVESLTQNQLKEVTAEMAPIFAVMALKKRGKARGTRIFR
jgi:hypothetical protein